MEFIGILFVLLIQLLEEMSNWRRIFDCWAIQPKQLTESPSMKRPQVNGQSDEASFRSVTAQSLTSDDADGLVD